MAEYKKPGVGTRILNSVLGFAVKLGASPQGAWLLTVNGRKSAKPMTTPVNPLEFGGARYLVAPRGDTHWSRNLRAARTGQLRRGRTRQPVSAVEVQGAEKPPVISAYLDRWAGVTKGHFGITWPNPSEEELTRVAARTPVFRIES